jgi:NCS2 family nucleobase:cation symporter-2
MATLAALSLNLLFRIGIRRKVEMTIEPGGEYADGISSFIERNAGIWGARRDVIKRLEFAVQQTVEAVIGFCEPKGAIRLDISYDEFVIDATVAYEGAALEFPDKPPTQEEIIETEEGHRRLAGFLIKRFADRMRTAGDGRATTVFLHFDH